MDKEKLQLIIQALGLINITANQAWWKEHQHCGADFHETNCYNCFAYEQCYRNEELVSIFKELSGQEG